MSARDFMPHRTLSGGSEERFAGSIDQNETFLEGEPVTRRTTGRVIECSSDPAAVAGISAANALDRHGNSLPLRTHIPIYGVGRSQVFKTRNIAIDGAGTLITWGFSPGVKSGTNLVGEFGGVIKAGDDWFLDVGANNKICEIINVEDAAGRNLRDPNTLTEGGGKWVFFRFIF
jgi:hypothetical protein